MRRRNDVETNSGSSYRSCDRRWSALCCGHGLGRRLTNPRRDGVSCRLEHLSVASLEAVGPYQVPRLVDTAGHNNGYVCGLAQPDSVRDAFCKQGGVVACLLAQLGLPHYVFKDDDSPASQRA